MASQPFATEPDMGAVTDEDSGIEAELCAAGFEDAEEAGQGGFGVVYRCAQVGLDRHVAVKVLTADVDDNRARFIREQKAMGRLTGHPNIVAVLQVGETASGHPYIVMPYHRKGSLQDRIRGDGLLPLEEVLRVGVKIAGALESAHRLGIVHRDVKPANILCTDLGEPALADFGIARVSGGFETATGVLTGSPAFTAPEVLSGETPTTASDVHSLGATLFCALTGHALFERRKGEQIVAMFLRVAAEPTPDLRERGIPADVAGVLEKAMSRDPAERPSALELGNQLRQLQSERGFIADEMALLSLEVSDGFGGEAARRASAPGPGGRLPSPLASFIGRRKELSNLQTLLTKSRLVTVTGIGGVGKTTLVTHAAHQLRGSFKHGVWLVELTDVTDSALVIEVVAAALGVRDRLGGSLSEVLVEFLGDRDALIVLDNCEQVTETVATLVETLLQGCPHLRILATSREILNVSGESVLGLLPLPCPDIDASTLGRMPGYDAVTMFIERAAAASGGFDLTAHNAAAVATICRRLDGLPLALELAAVRLRTMSADQIAEGLADRYSLLTRGRRGAPSRQQTLELCIRWSYDLCSSAERQLWGQLCVFAGSFELQAAHHVCAPDRSAAAFFDDLSALVDKSILIRTEHNGVVRLRLLESLREFGKTHIADYPLLRRRHASWYRRLVAQAHDHWYSPDQAEWIDRLTHEMPNIREALQFNLTEAPADASHMTHALRRIWFFNGMLGEGRRWAGQAVAAIPPEAIAQRIPALVAELHLATAQGDIAAANTRIAELRGFPGIESDPPTHGLITFLEGFGGMLAGRLRDARQSCQRALNITDDFEVQAHSLMTMGWLALIADDREQGVAWFERARTLAESRGDCVMQGHTLACMGTGLWRLGQVDRADEFVRHGLKIAYDVRDPWTGAQCLELLAWIARSRNDGRRAAVLMAAAASASHAIGSVLIGHAFLPECHVECEQFVHRELGAAEFDAAWGEGDSLSFDEAAALALAEND